MRSAGPDLGNSHEQNPRPGTIRQDRRQLSHQHAARQGQEPGAACRPHRRRKKTGASLDVATGGGHVAYTFAPHVARVWATDITQEMLDMVKAEGAKRGLANVRTAYAKAEALPFEDASFDLVTCRIAPHHFDSIPEFLAEVHRVLKPGGLFALVDNVVPAGSVGDYVNAFERFRDPSHLRAWTMEEWRAALKEAGLAVTHEEQIYKQMEFKSWAARHDATMQALLRAMLTQVTPEVKAVLEPKAERRRLYLPPVRRPVHRQARLSLPKRKPPASHDTGGENDAGARVTSSFSCDAPCAPACSSGAHIQPLS